MACTGIEFCKLAIVETKATAAAAIAELEQRLADVTDRLDTPITPARQRLPQLLRPHPDRRHRPQGPARHDDDGGQQSRASRSTSAAASPPPTATRPAWAAPCAA